MSTPNLLLVARRRKLSGLTKYDAQNCACYFALIHHSDYCNTSCFQNLGDLKINTTNACHGNILSKVIKCKLKAYMKKIKDADDTKNN
ncbi:hypothetical protein T4B_4414 [Trichinella pseudospiralis]|uniref:Uncharacterized protein n=1 Tax=Trichinella pseudospiralis TaxID=6337 RepID=A0A0V1HWV5_TRIPS|nr:hypothetical protein T4B_4414 [Trichinella pseudospiralis]